MKTCCACGDRFVVSEHSLDPYRDDCKDLDNVELCTPCGECPPEVLPYERLVLAANWAGLSTEERAARDAWWWEHGDE